MTLLAFLATGLAWGGPALAQGIAIDSVSTGKGGGGGTFNHTIGSGTNRYLVVAVGVNSFMGNTVSGVKYNNVNLTPIGTHTASDNPNPCISQLWALPASSLPSAGTYSVTITVPMAGGGVNQWLATALSFTGVDQNNLPSTKQSAIGTTTDPSVTITTGRAEFVVDCACLKGGTEPPLSVGPAQEERSNQVHTGGSVTVGVSTEPGVDLDPPSTGTTTMSWTGSTASTHWATSAIVLKPASTTAIRLSDLAVRVAGGGAQVLWRTGFEQDTLGFDIFRDDGLGPVRINRTPIVGSALRAGAGLPWAAGRTYRFLDPGAPPRSGTRYFLEEIDMGGRRSRHGPVTPARASVVPRSLEWLAAVTSAEETLPALEIPPPLYAESPLVPAGPAGETQRRLAQGGLVKIGIDQPGWYELDQQSLLAAGLDPEADPARLSFWQEGRPVPLRLTGQEDGRFDAGDTLGFYAQGLNSPYTNTRVYWLGSGDAPGLRLTSADDQAGPPVAAYSATLEYRPREIYFAALKNGPEENFFGPTVGGTPVSQILPLENVAAAAEHPFTLEVGLQGVSVGAHRIEVAANGLNVGTLRLADRARKSIVLPLPPSLLTAGNLEVTLTAGPDGKDISLIDFLRLSYPRRLVATSGRLWATLPGGTIAEVQGFAARQRVTAVDVTDPHAPAWVLEVLADETGAVRIPIAGSGARQILFTGESGRRTPAFVVKDTPSRFGAHTGGDLVIIGPASLLPAIAPLAEQRRLEGWQVLTVPLDDIFDEWAFGLKHPGAIRAFMRAALDTWGTRPRALLLLGDASFDPRNLVGKGDFDLLPTKLVETRYLETAFDDWFTDFDDDGIADIPVGRLPARTSADLAALVDKLLAAPRASTPRDADTIAVLAGADDDIHPFSLLAKELADLGAGRAAVATAQQTADAVASQQALAAALTLDPTLIAFAGHGSETQWAGGWLSNDRVGDLPTGSGRGGFWVTLTCLNGFFHDIHQTSLAETLLFRPRGGAFGVWASSGLTGLPEQAKIGRGALAALLKGGITVGEAAAQAKRLTNDLDVRRTWVLLGDPSWTWRAAQTSSTDVGAGDGAGVSADAGVPTDQVPAPAGDGSDAPLVTNPEGSTSGCGCRAGAAPGGGSGWVLLVVGLLLWRRRRPQPS